MKFWSREYDGLNDTTAASSYFPTCVIVILHVLFFAQVIVTPSTIVFIHLLVLCIILVDVVRIEAHKANSLLKDFVNG